MGRSQHKSVHSIAPEETNNDNEPDTSQVHGTSSLSNSAQGSSLPVEDKLIIFKNVYLQLLLKEIEDLKQPKPEDK